MEHIQHRDPQSPNERRVRVGAHEPSSGSSAARKQRRAWKRRGRLFARQLRRNISQGIETLL